MVLKIYEKDVSPRLWKTLQKLIGEPPELKEARTYLHEQRRTFEKRHDSAQQRIQELEQACEQAREERLMWMAKESSVRT